MIQRRRKTFNKSSSNKRTRFIFQSASERNVLLENNKILLEKHAELNQEEKIALRRENLRYIQKFFYKVMEKNPQVFKIENLLYLYKRKTKDDDFDHDLLIQDPTYYKNLTMKEAVNESNVVSISI